MFVNVFFKEMDDTTTPVRSIATGDIQLPSELTAELTKRKQQYQYYRDIILSGVSKVTKQKLGEVCAFKYGKGEYHERIYVCDY